ncbi:MAG: DUF308 domain-containing protein [Bacilli bacterium]|nr:DUF308 domain-containing protein [Bacilli bacterium]
MDNEEKSKRMKKLWFIWNLVEALLMLAAGVLAIVFGVMTKQSGSNDPNPTIETTVAAVIGAFVILDGILRIIMVLAHYKQTEQSVMLIGGFEITAGIVTILFHDIFVRFLVTFLSVFLLVIGALMLIFSIYAIAKRIGKLYMPVLEIIFGALMLGLGVAITIMYYNGESSNQIVLIVVGVIMAAFGITQAIIALVSYKKKNVVENENEIVPVRTEKPKKEKKPKKAQEEEVIDVASNESKIETIELKPEQIEMQDTEKAE